MTVTLNDQRKKIGLQDFRTANVQTSYLHSLFSTLLESITSRLATSKHLIFELVSVAEQAGLNLNLSETMKTGFLALRLIAVNFRCQFFTVFHTLGQGKCWPVTLQLQINNQALVMH